MKLVNIYTWRTEREGVRNSTDCPLCHCAAARMPGTVVARSSPSSYGDHVMADLAEYNAFMAKIRPLLQAATLVDLDDDVVRLCNVLKHVNTVYTTCFDGIPANLLDGDDIVVLESKGPLCLKFTDRFGCSRRIFFDSPDGGFVVEQTPNHTTYLVCTDTCKLGFNGNSLCLYATIDDATPELVFFYEDDALHHMGQGLHWFAQSDWFEINPDGKPVREASPGKLGYWKDEDFVLHIGSRVHAVRGTTVHAHPGAPEKLRLQTENATFYVYVQENVTDVAVASIIFGKWMHFVKMRKAARMAHERGLLAPDSKMTRRGVSSLPR